MNKYTLGTILGTVLIGLTKSKRGSNARKSKIVFDSAIDIRGYFQWEASFQVDEEISEQQSSEQQSSEQQSSEQQSDWNSSSEFDRAEMLRDIETDLQSMSGEIENELNDLIAELNDYRLIVCIEAKKWRDEGYEVEIGFYLVREQSNIDTWIDVDKVEEEFMEVFERISNEGDNIVSMIIENNFAIEGATLDYVDRDCDLEISENSSRVYIYAVDKNGVKKRVHPSPFLTSAPKLKLRKR